MDERAALKGVNEEQTASLQTALLHWARKARAVRTQMRTAQRGLHSNPVDIDGSSHQGLVELARCRSDLSLRLLAIACCVMDSLISQAVAAGAAGEPGLTLTCRASDPDANRSAGLHSNRVDSWSLLEDRANLKPAAAADLDALIAKITTVRTARAWLYEEQLREILERKQINVVCSMLEHWCICVMRPKVEPMKDVAALVRRHLEGIVAWAQTCQTNEFLEAINSLFQAAKRRARGFTRLSTIKTVIFLIVGKLDFHSINPHARQPT